jgi:hypothetical protein
VVEVRFGRVGVRQNDHDTGGQGAAYQSNR